MINKFKLLNPFSYITFFFNQIDTHWFLGNATAFYSSVKNGQHQLDEKLKDIVGLVRLKTSLRNYMQDMLADKLRRDLGAVQGYKRPVFLFLGNPGTGKTSIATLVAGKFILFKQ